MNILFASNNLSDWGNTPNQDTTAGHFDSARVPYAIAVPDDTYIPMRDLHNPPVGDTVWYGWRHYSPTYLGLGEDGRFARVYDATGAEVAQIDVIDGNLRAVAVGDSTVLGANWALVATNTVIKLDLSVQVNASGITVTLYSGGAAVSTATAANTSGKGVARQFAFDFVDALRTSDAAAFSEFIVAEADTSALRLDRIDPATAGNYSQWAGAISDITDGTDATGMTTTTANQRSSFNMDTFSSAGTITALVAVARASADSGGPQTFRQFIRQSAADYDGVANTLGPAPGMVVECWEQDPATAAAWTSAGVNSAEVGILSQA